MYRISLFSALCLALFCGASAAEDRRFVLLWSDLHNDPQLVDSYVVAWSFSPDPPFPVAHYGITLAPYKAHEFDLVDLVPGDVLYFSVKACNIQGQCGPWAPAAEHIVVAQEDIDPPVAVLIRRILIFFP